MLRVECFCSKDACMLNKWPDTNFKHCKSSFLHSLKKQTKARQILLCIWKMKKKSKTVFFLKKNLKSRYVPTRILHVRPNPPKIYNFSSIKLMMENCAQNHINKIWCTIQSYRAFNSLHSSHACFLMMWGSRCNRDWTVWHCFKG